MTPAQRQQAIERLQGKQAAPDPVAAVLARRRACPPCGHTLCRGWGRAHGVPRLRCAAGGKTFNVLTGTPLARLRNRACWGAYAQALIDGPSVRAAACTRIPPVAGATASLPSPPRIKPAHLHGIVAADETDFLESHKEERHLPRPPHQRGGVATKRGLSDEQIPVLIVRDRRATTTDAVLPKANTAAISAVLGPILDPDAVRCSDSSAIYCGFAEAAHLAHTGVNLSAGIRVIDHAFHLQNVNAYHGRLKGWMARCHGVATQYLPNYLGWRRFLERLAPSISPALVLNLAINGGQHLTQT